MHRRLRNLSLQRQLELSHQFKWLRSCHTDESREGIRQLSVCVFDHWLSREEACELLENIPSQEQLRRYNLLANFCDLLVSGTSLVSFIFRGKYKNRLLFRDFTLPYYAKNYCKPHGGRMFGHRHFQVALPEMNCVFYESWDDTYHFFFTDTSAMAPIYNWAKQSKVFILTRG